MFGAIPQPYFDRWLRPFRNKIVKEDLDLVKEDLDRRFSMPPTRSRQSGVTSTARRAAAELPPYEPLAHPLNPSAQRELNQLLNTSHPLKSLEKHLDNVTELLGENAGSITEIVATKDIHLKKTKARLQSQRELSLIHI